MYKTESLKKALALMQEKKRLYTSKEVNEIVMCISNGNIKIGRVMNVSLPPIVTCANCKECMHFCYDVKACLQYPNTVIDARMRNYVLLLKDRDEYFARIDKAMTRRRKNKYFRFHVAGDIIDVDYFDRMVKTAKAHTDFMVWTYTKNYAIVNEWIKQNGKENIPSNLSIMFSKWDGLKMDNPYNMPVFACKMKDGNKDAMPWGNMYKCPGNCDLCKACKKGCIGKENTYCDEH